MKYILIILLHFQLSASVSTAEFDTELACLKAIRDIQAIRKDWSALEFKMLCLPKGDQ